SEIDDSAGPTAAELATPRDTYRDGALRRRNVIYPFLLRLVLGMHVEPAVVTQHRPDAVIAHGDVEAGIDQPRQRNVPRQALEIELVHAGAERLDRFQIRELRETALRRRQPDEDGVGAGPIIH